MRIILKTKQYSVQVVEVELQDETEFIAFFEKNYHFFQNHLIAINGKENQKIKAYLDAKGLHYIFNTTLPKRKSGQQSKQISPPPAPEPPKRVQSIEKNLTVLDKLVRSGQELKIDGDLLLLSRVNSGASVIVDGTLIIIQPVDGSIRCNGNFMMLQASQKANIVFHGVEVDNKYLQERLSRVELIDNEIVITPVLKERSWV